MFPVIVQATPYSPQSQFHFEILSRSRQRHWSNAAKVLKQMSATKQPKVIWVGWLLITIFDSTILAVYGIFLNWFNFNILSVSNIHFSYFNAYSIVLLSVDLYSRNYCIMGLSSNGKSLLLHNFIKYHLKSLIAFWRCMIKTIYSRMFNSCTTLKRPKIALLLLNVHQYLLFPFCYTSKSVIWLQYSIGIPAVTCCHKC